jgi:NitT/TauT family transport system substrate-binding protein
VIQRRSLLASAAVATLARPAWSGEMDKATLRMDWALSGYQVPFYWAKSKGYYEAEGIDLTITDGAGSAKSAQLVSARQDTFGLVDALVTANSIAKGMKIRSTYVVVQDGGGAIVSWDAKPFRTPQDMVGHSVAGAAEQKSLLELFLAVNKIPKDSVTVRVVSVAARNQVFYQHEVDGIVSTVIGSPMDMIVAAKEGRGDPIHIMPFSDFGVSSMTTAVVVHDDTIASKPDLVKRFIRASNKGLVDIIDPAKADAATDAAMQISAAPSIRRESVKLQWLATLPRLQTAANKGKPLGWTSDADWQNCVDLLVKTEQMEKPVSPSTLYTNAFIPA